MVVSHGVGMSRVIKEREGERVAGGSGRERATRPGVVPEALVTSQ